MKENLFLFIITGSLLCSVNAGAQHLDWSISKEICFAGEAISFENQSGIKPDDSVFVWNFGDDCGESPVYSRRKCNLYIPGISIESHTYSKPGNYEVSLHRSKTPGIILRKKIVVIRQDANPAVNKSVKTEAVDNGGFESCSGIPVDVSGLELAEDWFSPTSGTPDLFHSGFDTAIIYDFSVKVPDNFAGNSIPADSGNVYAGFISVITMDSTGRFSDTTSDCHNYREYLQQLLNRPLTRGIKYEISYHIKLSSHSRFATKTACCLTAEYITGDSTSVIYQEPLINTGIITDTSSWTKISRIITAKGDEKYLTIGNFSNDGSSCITDVYPGNLIKSVYGAFRGYASYYYIDKVSIRKISAYELERSAIVSSGKSYSDDQFFLDYSVGQRVTGTYRSGDTSLWLTQGILQPLADENINKNYIIPADQKELNIAYFPNPTTGILNIGIKDTVTGSILLTVFNMMGHKAMCLLGEKASQEEQVFKADLSMLKNGTYIIMLRAGDKKSSFIKIIKL